ncbi:MAG: molybdopterin-dependent oxidoreductase [Deltaproteobacteria bacterium]|jgi:sulfoxide reductase catalytic subunit YedY|nr:molybdopterin-dependent oxidoreductase [Deltaproteobacteria bacterium]MBW2485831.1 molybdopterin-dependent oxidoreductase [Deltaproteobacteria bacterium]
MKTRRQFITWALKLLAVLSTFVATIRVTLIKAWAQAKRFIVPRDTDLSTLRNKDPATLDTRNLEILPLEAFETMGLSNHPVHLPSWRLIVEGNVAVPTRIPYSEITKLPSIERKVLLICPGVFVNHGRWKGLSLMTVLDLARMEPDTSHIRVYGPQGAREKVERFPIADIRSDKVFLAYEVNGEKLPVRHGFPLRIVAEDYYGDDWVKYVYRIEAIKMES